MRAISHTLIVWSVLSLLQLASAPMAYGQQSDAPAEVTQMAFVDGVAAVRDGNVQQATQLLRPVMRQAPDYFDDEQGAVAYWLGQAYATSGQVERALRTWRRGIIALHESNRFEVRLADAYIRHVFEHQAKGHYRLAADAYVRMLRALDGNPTAQEATLLGQHLEMMMLILPEQVKDEAGLTAARLNSHDLTHVTSDPIVAWWRSQDPLSATLKNERLIEHLERVVYAQQHYADSSSPTGLDDRGEIYMRYGPPKHREVIHFNETRLTDEIFRPGVNVNLSDFPMNEFWSYGHIDRSGYYVFVKEDDAYRTATFDELLPRKLRSGFTPSKRGRRRSYLALATMRAIYRRLSPYHPQLALRHDEVANYLADVTNVGLTSRNDIDESRSLNTQTRRASQFAEKTIRENRNRDQVAARVRRREMPSQASGVFRDTERLDVAARTARFLDENGTTRTEIYWSPAPDALKLTEDTRASLEDEGYEEFGQYIVRLTAAQKEADYQNRVINQKHYQVNSLPEEGATIPAQTLEVYGDTAFHHLSLQWDQYLIARNEQGNSQAGPRVKVATVQKDSIEALTDDDRVLEMSDLRVMVLPPDASETALDRAIPYPFRQVTSEMSLVLYFEVYHLTFADGDESRYTVEYQVQRRSEGGGLVQLFRGDDTKETTAQTTHAGRDRTAKEYIMLDLSDWSEEGPLKVTVRVTDEATGQHVERSVDLEAAR